MKRQVFFVILCGLLLLPGLLFASGSQEPPELTGSVTVDMWHAMGGFYSNVNKSLHHVTYGLHRFRAFFERYMGITIKSIPYNLLYLHAF